MIKIHKMKYVHKDAKLCLITDYTYKLTSNKTKQLNEILTQEHLNTSVSLYKSTNKT